LWELASVCLMSRERNAIVALMITTVSTLDMDVHLVTAALPPIALNAMSIAVNALANQALEDDSAIVAFQDFTTTTKVR
jgi:hypothetical protein